MDGYTEKMVYLVGAGPGDPGLITLKGMECLSRADVVIYDYLAAPALLAYAPPRSQKIYVGKSASRHTMEQDEINALLIEKARTNGVTVRLKGGDPFVFGRGGEECAALQDAGIPYEIVPGITAGIAAPAYAGIPVTHRGVAASVAFVTGNEDPAKPSTDIAWDHLVKGVDTLVFYMGMGNLPSIVTELLHYGRPSGTPVAVIRWGTKPGQQTVTGTLDSIVDIVNKASVKPPAIIVVGEVVGLRERLSWFEKRPLFGKRIINTRARAQASALSQRLAALGAEMLELPTIEIVPAGSGSTLAEEIADITKYEWIIFTSPNGVETFFDLFFARHGDIRALGKVRFASIGPAGTAALEKYHLQVDVTAEEAVAEGLLRSLRGAVPSWKDMRVLLPRAKKARDILPETLTAWGASVTVATAYTAHRPQESDRAVIESVLRKEYDLITFSSSSTFENFCALFTGEEFSQVASSLRAASIGPITSATIRSHGIVPLVEARTYTIAGLVAAIEGFFNP